jgi:pyruvate formate lyase activating enzyme
MERAVAWDRRTFLARCAGCAAAFGLAPLLASPARAEDVFEFEKPDSAVGGASNVRASWWDAMPDGRVTCRLCPRECRVADQERGTCGVRANEGGVYKTLVHSRVAAVHVDPVEKKPFFHVAPGSVAYSLATAGCNMQCRFCQNWELSQFRPEQVPSVEAAPERIVAAARASGAPFIAYTYSEPVIFFEYMRDIADAGLAAGIRSLVISNGYIQEKPLRDLLTRVAAVKIDLKGFTEEYYRDICDAQLKPVLETLKVLDESDVWFEIVVLVVPTLNDDETSMRGLCDWVAENLGPEVPVHFTRFHPSYRLQNLPVTPVMTLERIHGYARAAGLSYAYIGNVPGHAAENTVCPGCGKVLVLRSAYTVLDMAIKDGRCPSCARVIPGLWS